MRKTLRPAWLSIVLIFVLRPLPVHAAPLDGVDLDIDITSETRPEEFAPGEAPPEPTPDKSQGPFAQAVAAFRAGEIDACLAKLRDAVAESPTLPAPDLILAEFYLDAGQATSARRLLEQAAAEDSSHPQLFLTFGRLALAEGRLTEALLHYEKMEALGAPKGWSAAEKEELEAAVIEGKTIVAERRGNWEAAQLLLSEWVQLQPDRAGLRHRWARALLLAGREKKAFEQFDIAYRQDPRLNRPEAAIGAVYASRGQFDKANPFFARAIEAHPDDGPLNYAWAMALLFQDRIREAEEFAKRASAAGIDTNKSNLLQGEIARGLEDYADAELYFRRVLERAPEHQAASLQLILTLASQQDEAKRAEALTLAKANVQQHPQSPAAMAGLGAALAAAGEYDQAQEAFAKIAQRPDASLETLLLFGKTLEQNGQLDEARQLAHKLRQRIDRPGIFINRPAARDWIAHVLP